MIVLQGRGLVKGSQKPKSWDSAEKSFIIVIWPVVIPSNLRFGLFECFLSAAPREAASTLIIDSFTSYGTGKRFSEALEPIFSRKKFHNRDLTGCDLQTRVFDCSSVSSQQHLERLSARITLTHITQQHCCTLWLDLLQLKRWFWLLSTSKSDFFWRFFVFFFEYSSRSWETYRTFFSNL